MILCERTEVTIAMSSDGSRRDKNGPKSRLTMYIPFPAITVEGKSPQRGSPREHLAHRKGLRATLALCFLDKSCIHIDVTLNRVSKYRCDGRVSFKLPSSSHDVYDADGRCTLGFDKAMRP